MLLSRQFGPLFAAQFLSAFNDNALKNALVLMIAYRPETAGGLSPGLLIPLAGGLFILPFFLFSATAGELADLRDKARLIRVIKLIEIPVMLVAAGFVIAGHAGWLLALLFAMGVQAAFFGPLKYAILPDLLPPERLLLGNALIEAGTFLAILLGTIAGMLIASEHGGFSVAVLIVVVALAAWGFSRAIPATRPAAAGLRPSWNIAAATGRLIAEAAGQKVPFRAMLAISWFWLVGAIYLSQFPTYVRFVLGSDEAVVTLFLTVFSVGVGAGSLLCNRLLRGRISAGTVPWGALGIALFSVDLWAASPAATAASVTATLGAFLAAPRDWRILADLFGIAVSGGLFIVPLYALLQTEGDPSRRARTIAGNNVINAAAMVLSALLTVALVAAGTSVAGLFLLTGLATLPVAVLSRWIAQPPRDEAARTNASGKAAIS
jgi:MFS family permease